MLWRKGCVTSIEDVMSFPPSTGLYKTFLHIILCLQGSSNVFLKFPLCTGMHQTFFQNLLCQVLYQTFWYTTTIYKVVKNISVHFHFLLANIGQNSAKMGQGCQRMNPVILWHPWEHLERLFGTWQSICAISETNGTDRQRWHRWIKTQQRRVRGARGWLQ